MSIPFIVRKLVLFCCLAAAAPVFAASLEELSALVESASREHPRLFFREGQLPDLKEKVVSDPLLRGTLEYLLACAVGMQSVEPVKRELEGKRLLGVSRTCLRRVTHLAFAYLMTGEASYARRAEKEMLAAAAFEDWNPSHFLDVAEMTAALGIGYDWLYDALPEESRKTIRDAIVEKGLRCSQRADFSNWWIMTTNNWNQVCHGGLVLGALAVLEDEPALAQEIIERAVKNLPRAMNEYEPDGVYPEGPSYWAYGTTYNVLLIDAIESVLGDDFGLGDSPGFMRSPEFYLYATGPTGLYYNFSDCGARGGVAPAMHWFAARRDDPSLLWQEKKALEEFIKGTPGGEGGSDRLLPLLLVWARPLENMQAPAQLNWHGAGRTPVAMLRSGWDEDEVYVGIKGGSPETNHAHMDIGSFVLDMNGVRWAVDLGAQDYNSLESRGIDLWNKSQDSQRWTVFRLNNHSHNTLVVGGQLQDVQGDAAITRFGGEAEIPFAIVDMSPVYGGQLKQVLRGIQLDTDRVTIQDEVEALEKESVVRWGMATNAEVAVAGSGNTATLSQDGKTMHLTVASPKDARLTVVELATPPHDFDAANPNTRMIILEIVMPPLSKETIRVVMSATEYSPPPTSKPLANW